MQTRSILVLARCLVGSLGRVRILTVGGGTGEKEIKIENLIMTGCVQYKVFTYKLKNCINFEVKNETY